jgi:hypothetical protein
LFPCGRDFASRVASPLSVTWRPGDPANRPRGHAAARPADGTGGRAIAILTDFLPARLAGEWPENGRARLPMFLQEFPMAVLPQHSSTAIARALWLQ